MAVPLTVTSVPAQTPYVQYVATSNQTVFPYPFEITQDSDLVCLINGVTQATDSGYTLSGQGTTGGGNLTFSAGQAVGAIITIFRDIPIARITQLSQNGTFFSSNFNNEFNRIYLIMQQLQEQQAFMLQVPITNSGPVTTLTPALYANKYLAFDANGNPTPAALTTSGAVTASLVGGFLFPQTALELGALVTPVSTVYDSNRGDDVRRFGVVGDNATDNTATLVTANSVGASLYFPPGKYKVASNLTLSVPLFMDYGAILVPAAGVTITINASVTAGIYQIFNCAASTSAIAGRMRAAMYPVEWWGATGNGITGLSGVVATISTAFTDANAAFKAADVGKSIYIVPPTNSALATFIGTIAAYVSATAVTLNTAPAWASSAAFTATCSTTTLTVSAVSAGTIFAGQAVVGAAAGTIINYQLTGTTGGTGTYNVSISQTVGSATAMTSSSLLAYYYGTDDTAAIVAANATVGQLALSAGPNTLYTLSAATTQLNFIAPNIYLMSASAMIGATLSTVGGKISTTAAMQWKGVGGLVTIAFGIVSSTTDCVIFGQGGNTVNAGIEDIRFDNCFSGRDGLVLAGFQNPFLRNVRVQNSQRDSMSITPAAGSFIQQGDFQNIYLGPSGRHNIYVNPASGTFVNECDWSNVCMQYPSSRQANGTALYFDAMAGAVDSWTFTNYKASLGWAGDPNYEALGSFFTVAAGVGIFPTAGITMTSGYCENGVTANPLGATVAPVSLGAGSTAMIHMRGFYNSYWGVAITHADHDAASQFTVLASGSQLLVSNPAYYAYIGDFVLNVTDGTNSDYLRFQATVGKNATGHLDYIGTKMSVGTPPTYTVTVGNSSDKGQVTFNNTGAVTLTIAYSAKTVDCGSAPAYYY